MIKTVYQKVWAFLGKKPLKLWGISLLNVLLISFAYILFPGVIAAAIVIEVLLSAAMTMTFLRGYCGEEVCVEDLFVCFKDKDTAKRVTGGMLWAKLWVFLWSLIPMVGPVFGTIRTYEYRFVPYILLTEPEVKAKEAIKVSKERTEGWKAKMFWADVLVYVVLFAVLLVLLLLSSLRGLGWFFGILFFVVSVAAVAFMPLINGVIKAGCYEEVKYAAAHPKQTGGEAHFCPACGAPVSVGNVFCSSCGHKLNDN